MVSNTSTSCAGRELQIAARLGAVDPHEILTVDQIRIEAIRSRCEIEIFPGEYVLDDGKLSAAAPLSS